jgi:hypothetical protein
LYSCNLYLMNCRTRTPEFRCDHPTAFQFEAVPDSKTSEGEHVWVLRTVSLLALASADAPVNASSEAEADDGSAGDGTTDACTPEPATTEGVASTEAKNTGGGDGCMLTAISPSEIVDGPLPYRRVSYVPGKRGLNAVAWGSALTQPAGLMRRQQWVVNFAM